MLEIKLERAMGPSYMQEQPCGICGADFTPEAVLACHVTPFEYVPVCDVCLDHLARRAREEAIPAHWNEVYLKYIRALEKYPEPVFASEEELEAAEEADPTGAKMSAWNLVDV